MAQLFTCVEKMHVDQEVINQEVEFTACQGPRAGEAVGLMISKGRQSHKGEKGHGTRAYAPCVPRMSWPKVRVVYSGKRGGCPLSPATATHAY